MDILYFYISDENNKENNINYNTIWQAMLQALYNHCI